MVVEEKKTVVVTGARGMLGSSLCKTLVRDYTVIGLDLPECDITKPQVVSDALKGVPVDSVIHCAAYTAVDKAEDEPSQAACVNVEGTRNLVKEVEGRDCLFVYISTDYVFDGKKEAPYTEDDYPGPLGVYGRTKWEGEKVVQEYTRHVIVRTSWTYGPDGNNFVKRIGALARERDEIEVVDDQRGAPTYTVDLSKALKKLVDRHCAGNLEWGTYHVVNSESCSWFEFAKYIVQIVGAKAEIKPIKSINLKRPARRPENSLLSGAKFAKLVGYQLRPWKEAVAEYITQYSL